MDLFSKIRNIVTRAVVDLRDSAGRYQVLWGGDRASAGVEHFQPQGLHFAAPADATGLLVAPGGDKSAAVLVSAHGDTPVDSLSAGTGGLHYLGEWRVFVSDDGTVHLGARAPADFAALASVVDAQLAKLAADLNTLKGATQTVATAVDVIAPGTGAAFTSATALVPQTMDPVGSQIVRIE